MDPNYSFFTSKVDHSAASLNNFLFNSSKYHSSNDDTTFFYILNNDKKSVEGKFCLVIQENKGFSPFNAPFGSVDISKSIAPQILFDFLDFILVWAKSRGLKSLHIKNFPMCYDPYGGELLLNAYHQKGFLLENVDISQYIDINKDISFSQSAKLKIIKCVKAGFLFEKMIGYSIEEIYTLIKRNRQKKGYPITITLEKLTEQVNNSPDRYLFFSVKDGTKLISVSICVVVNKDIIYDFAHAHSENYNKFSPVIYLIDGICKYCKEKGVKILDLGLSTSNSEVNRGLYDFKSRLGTRPSIKLSFTKFLT